MSRATGSKHRRCGAKPGVKPSGTPGQSARNNRSPQRVTKGWTLRRDAMEPLSPNASVTPDGFWEFGRWAQPEASLPRALFRRCLRHSDVRWPCFDESSTSSWRQTGVAPQRRGYSTCPPLTERGRHNAVKEVSEAYRAKASQGSSRTTDTTPP
jgi:hypothetical protein